MWKLLSDSCHVKAAETYAARAAVLRPFMNRLTPVLRTLSTRSYSNQVFGHWSLAVFHIGTAPSYEFSNPLYPQILCIDQDKRGFLVGCGESAHSEWGISNGKRVGCWTQCTSDDIVSIIDRIVERELADLNRSDAS